jgi:hypothetical protein
VQLAHRKNADSCFFDFGDDFADVRSRGGIGFDEGKSAFNSHKVSL